MPRNEFRHFSKRFDAATKEFNAWCAEHDRPLSEKDRKRIRKKLDALLGKFAMTSAEDRRASNNGV